MIWMPNRPETQAFVAAFRRAERNIDRIEEVISKLEDKLQLARSNANQPWGERLRRIRDTAAARGVRWDRRPRRRAQ